MINNGQGAILQTDNFFQIPVLSKGNWGMSSAVKEMQGKKINLRTMTDWNVQSFTDLVLQVTWKETL